LGIPFLSAGDYILLADGIVEAVLKLLPGGLHAGERKRRAAAHTPTVSYQDLALSLMGWTLH